MRPLEYPLAADENIHPLVVAELRARGRDIVTADDLGAAGAGDRRILAAAHAASRVVLTHDRDFGTLGIREGEPFTGIVFLRPGHINPAVVLAMLDAVAALAVEVVPPFILVAELRGQRVHVQSRLTPVPRDPERPTDVTAPERLRSPCPVASPSSATCTPTPRCSAPRSRDSTRPASSASSARVTSSTRAETPRT
jgi:predicted nuclease of predicted toxin-antitoxin system